ncbi:WhiB family transcriptional regulator [Streptomyces mirabilis]|uniref:WhiB family transcriptional regulator n=1 Tax=Streptomyces mirabilis TaxID=68239 RepID=UPI00332CEE98
MQEWIAKGACADPDVQPETFFAPNERSGSRGWDRKAKQICRRCAVRRECLQSAIRHNVRDGVWGGLNLTERFAMQARNPEASRVK